MSRTAEERDEVRTEFGELVNMAPAELEEFLESPESQEVGQKSGEDEESTGHASGRRIVELLRTNAGDLSDDDVDHMAKVVGYVKRHRAQGGPDEDVEGSRWRHSLMNWGHDPLK